MTLSYPLIHSGYTLQMNGRKIMWIEGKKLVKSLTGLMQCSYLALTIATDSSKALQNPYSANCLLSWRLLHTLFRALCLHKQAEFKLLCLFIHVCMVSSSISHVIFPPGQPSRRILSPIFNSYRSAVCSRFQDNQFSAGEPGNITPVDLCDLVFSVSAETENFFFCADVCKKSFEAKYGLLITP